MNIIVKPLEGICTCRPDTTWERENKDIYAPQAVVAYRYAPVLFIRICKAGKCVGYKFASRYYDGFNFGVLLYGGVQTGKTARDIMPERIRGEETTELKTRPATIPGTESASEASAIHWSECLDHSSILPFPLYSPVVLGNDELGSSEKKFTLRKNGTVLFSTVEGSAEMAENAVVKASELVSLRIGDIIAIELQEPLPMTERPSGDGGQDCLLTGDFLETEIFRHQIIF